MILQIPGDAFSDGQVRSKLWLAKHLSLWSQKYLTPSEKYILNWYGAWVGLGPFLVLSLCELELQELNLIELDLDALNSANKILEHWEIRGLKIQYLKQDMNFFVPIDLQNQLFINTSCEHVRENDWLEKIPAGTFLLLQSTDMIHEEHINCPSDIEDFKNKYTAHIEILEFNQIDFSYPGKAFSRFMLFGRRSAS